MADTPRVGIVKTDVSKRLVFGWSTIAEKNGEPLVDLQGDMIEPAELEDAVYDFMLHSRESGAMHEGVAKGRIVESVVFTPEKLTKMGFEGTPFSAHWIGVKLDDQKTFEKVQNGEYTAFSIQGSARKVPA